MDAVAEAGVAEATEAVVVTVVATVVDAGRSTGTLPPARRKSFHVCAIFPSNATFATATATRR